MNLSASCGLSTWSMASWTVGISGLPDVRANVSQGTRSLRAVTLTCSSRPTSGPGVLSMAHQIPVIEVDHGINPWRLMEGGIERSDLGGQVPDRSDIVAIKQARPGSMHEHVYRLEQAHPPARLEHPVKLAQRQRFVFDVNQHRPGSDHIDRCVRHGGQAIGAGQHELAAVELSFGADCCAAVVKQVLGNVGKDHVP